MYIFVSHKNTLDQDIWAGVAHCPCCNNDSHFHLKKLKHKAHLYGLLPILTYTEKRYIICDNCGASREMKRKEYREMHEKQMEKLACGQIPSEIVSNDYSPRELKMVWRWIKFIIASLFALSAVFVATLLPYYETGFWAVIMSWLMFLPVGLVPFCFILPDFIEAIKKQNAYSKVMKGTYTELAENAKPSESRKNIVKVVTCAALILAILSPVIGSFCGKIAAQRDEIEDPVTEVINEDGVLCDIDIFTNGEIVEDAVPISEKVIVLAGRSYESPIKIYDLINDGWELEDPYAYLGQSFIGSVYLMGWGSQNRLVHESGVQIDIDMVYSETLAYSLTSCTLTRFTVLIDPDTQKSGAGFVLPGGITQNSMAADVIKVYGNPNSSKKFSFSKSSEDSFNYSYQDDSDFSYEFQFNKDGSINQVEVTIPSK